MNNPFFRAKFGVIISCALVSLIILLGAGRAWALPAIQFDVFFGPTYEDWKLQGTLHVQDSFIAVGNANMPIDPCIPTDPCRTFFDVFSDAAPGSSSFSFEGVLR